MQVEMVQNLQLHAAREWRNSHAWLMTCAPFHTELLLRQNVFQAPFLVPEIHYQNFLFIKFGAEKFWISFTFPAPRSLVFETAGELFKSALYCFTFKLFQGEVDCNQHKSEVDFYGYELMKQGPDHTNL